MVSKRRRLGVALLLDPPLSHEVDGIRRALGDPSMGRMPPHLTLVPPVNVRSVDLPAALRVLREAAAAQRGPLRLALGAPSTFLPVNPVLYLAVGGDLERLVSLRDAVFRPPLERHLPWPWVPHVTLADGAEPERIKAALSALSAYAVVADLDRVVLLEETPGRVWRPLADAALGRPARLGTGGLPLELTAGRVLDPEVLSLLAADAQQAHQRDTQQAQQRDAQQAHQWGAGQEAIVLTARREGHPVGAGVAWLDSHGPHVGVWVSPGHRMEGIGSKILAHLEAAARRAGWAYPQLDATGPAQFYRAVSRWSVPAGTGCYPKATEE